uniref:Uncharacterized protein n=1 Tax=Chlamydomonas euryale TaxID=1486919 RepID=A0A7R9YS29_9CHLO|mmetsp:Transcript_16283/g.48516  ORF Transcript_16283/g.48516 Transcript_16283/m.48516 type:complete len:106 (+) Transcript_16283:436-753(+)
MRHPTCMNQTQAVCDTTCVPFFQAMWHAGRAFRTQTAEQTNPPDTTRPQQAVQLPFLQLQGSGTPARSAAARIVMPRGAMTSVRKPPGSARVTTASPADAASDAA